MTEYSTASVPKPLAEDIKRLIKETGYWPSFSAFVRAACLAKLHTERARRLILKEEAEG